MRRHERGRSTQAEHAAAGRCRDDAWRQGTDRIIGELMGVVDELHQRLDALEKRQVLRLERLEIADANGVVRAALGEVEGGGTFGLESYRTDGTMAAFLGDVGGDGGLMFTARPHNDIVVDLGVSSDRPHLVVDRGVATKAEPEDLLASPTNRRRGKESLRSRMWSRRP